MSRIIILNKPYNVLCQFTDSEGRSTLADFLTEKGLYPAGRLDRDSEGLVLLTDDGKLQNCISHPRHKMEKSYWVQVEGVPDESALQALRSGVKLKDGLTQPAMVERIDEPRVWPRHPPIRYRAAIPTTWLNLRISEGRNRQVRRMTAAVGYPTLRLIRHAIGPWSLDSLMPGEYRETAQQDVKALQNRCRRLQTNQRKRAPAKGSKHSPQNSKSNTTRKPSQ